MNELSEMVFLKEPQRRFLLSVVLAVLAGVVLLTMIGGVAPGSRTVPGETPAAPAAPADNLRDLERDLAGALASALAAVEGVGAVRVQVALAAAVDREFATDTSLNRTTTEETDVTGGRRVVTQVEETGKIVPAQAGAGTMPLLRRERRPEIRGVLVVAEGAGDARVRAALTRAVGAALDVPLYRVVVLPGKPDPEGGIKP